MEGVFYGDQVLDRDRFLQDRPRLEYLWESGELSPLFSSPSSLERRRACFVGSC